MAMSNVIFIGTVFPSPEEWSKRAKKALEKISVYNMYDSRGLHVGEWIGNFENVNDIDHRLVKTKAWVFTKTIKSIEKLIAKEKAGVYIGHSLWTCNCESNFIQSKLSMECAKCGGTLEGSIIRIPYHDKILFWDDFTIDARNNPISQDDSSM